MRCLLDENSYQQNKTVELGIFTKYWALTWNMFHQTLVSSDVHLAMDRNWRKNLNLKYHLTTVAWLITDMGEYISKKISDYIVKCKKLFIMFRWKYQPDRYSINNFFSLHFKRIFDQGGNVKFSATTLKGSDIFQAVNRTVIDYGGF